MPFGPDPCWLWEPWWLPECPQGWYACRGYEERLQRHINHLNNCRERGIGHRLKLSLQIVGKGFGFLRVCESDSPGVTKDRRVGTLITRLVNLHSDWSSGSREKSVAPHWSFPHSTSRPVTDLCRRLTSASKAGSLLTCHCLHSRFVRRISSSMPAGSGGRGSSRERHLRLDAATAFRTAPEKFSTHVSIAIPLCNSGSHGIWSFKWIWKLTHSVRLQSRRPGGWKDERHAVSMSTARWSELSEEHEVRYTGKGSSYVITISKTSGVPEVLYGLVVDVSGPKIRQ